MFRSHQSLPKSFPYVHGGTLHNWCYFKVLSLSRRNTNFSPLPVEFSIQRKSNNDESRKFRHSPFAQSAVLLPFFGRIFCAPHVESVLRLQFTRMTPGGRTACRVSVGRNLAVPRTFSSLEVQARHLQRVHKTLESLRYGPFLKVLPFGIMSTQHESCFS